MNDTQLALFPSPGRPGSYTPPVANQAPLSARSSLSAAVSAFHTYMTLQGFSENTVKAFAGDLRLLMKYLPPSTNISRISTHDLENFLSWLLNGRGVPCNAKSYARRLTTLKVFFKWLYDTGIVASDPAAPIAHQPVSTPLPDILYDDEVERLLRYTRDLLWAPKPDARPYVLVSLILQTAIKKSECMGIKLEHIDASNPHAPVLYIRYPSARYRHKERKLALAPQWITAMRQYVAQYKPQTYLFECTARNLEYVLADAGQLAGIENKSVSFEVMRWTAAVRDYRTGMSPEHLRKKLGLTKVSWRETGLKIRQLAGAAL
ncbi:MAG: site-specific integrase [Caldilineales bacterium]|nr:site-specific integrase [Caldilineales bacterium]MDW8319618.1 site-specific integrase [Anaerolineae bacterium]